ncbi:MAG: hypothetical protein QOG13_1770 [Sphingomonadales bacterium]|jgi:hypothetical protein|nr:hypothetical protein [Sphingomonadales bacterium]
MRNRLLIGAALLALAGCGQSGGGAEERARTAPPANIIVTSPEGTAEVRTGGALTGLPEGIPAYPGADTTASVDVSGGQAQDRGRVIGFRTSDTPAQVVAFYGQSVGGAGYRIANQMNMGPTASLTAQRGEGEVVNIVATQAGGFTQVQIIVARGH